MQEVGRQPRQLSNRGQCEWEMFSKAASELPPIEECLERGLGIQISATTLGCSPVSQPTAVYRLDLQR